MKGENGRVVSGLDKQRWYVELRGAHPTERECWPTDMKQVTAVKAERDRHPMPAVVSVRPYLRTVLLGEPYAPGDPAARMPSSCERGCVNPWHSMKVESAAVHRLPAGSRRRNDPLTFEYLEVLVMRVWSEVCGLDEQPMSFYNQPDIPVHHRRVKEAINMLWAKGRLDPSTCEPLEIGQRAAVMSEAGFQIQTDGMPDRLLTRLRGDLPMPLRVALGLDPDSGE